MTTDSPQPGARRPRWRRWLVEGLIVVAILFGIHWWQTRDVVYGPAPALSGVLLGGPPVSLAAEAGKPVLVHFWAEWCPICKLEQGSIQSISDDYRVLSVATTSGDAAAVKAFMAEQGISFPTLVDEDGTVGRAWGIKGVPASFVIDPQGQIVHATVGYTTEIGLRARLWWAGR